jgi:threonine dehydrogenase-like Zn-dependent dehydrogenase
LKGLWLNEGRLRFRDDLPVPEPAPAEALVRVLQAGICNTDLEILGGYRPHSGILGHEFVGVVERSGSGVSDSTKAELSGRRVVGEINVACGTCASCKAGRRIHCEERSVLGIMGRDGSFAEHLCLPISNLHLVPDGVSSAAAVFTEPLAAALAIQSRVAIDEGDRVLIVGAGKLGLLIAQTLALTGCNPRVVTTGRGAAGKLLDGWGIESRSVEEVEAGAYDLAVECTGNPAGFALARSALRPRGALVLKSTYAGHPSIDATSLVVDEITVIGSRCGPFEPALSLLEGGQVDVEALVQATYPLERGEEALEHAARPGVLKVLLEIGE